VARRVTPRAVRNTPELLADFQRMLGRLGVPLEWPVYGALTPFSRTGYRPAR
jgi:hypothetical protein